MNHQRRALEARAWRLVNRPRTSHSSRAFGRRFEHASVRCNVTRSGVWRVTPHSAAALSVHQSSGGWNETRKSSVWWYALGGAAAAASSASLLAVSDNNNNNKSWPGGGLWMCNGKLPPANTAFCEVAAAVAVQELHESSSDSKPVLEQEEDDDPYANLPEEDEPTDCSMCNTFRQGPCRPLWRKFEHCHSDNAEVEGDEFKSKCQRYAILFEGCRNKYAGLYELIANDVGQDQLEWFQKQFGEVKKRLPLPSINWKPCHDVFQKLGASFSQTIPGVTFPKDTPLWKKFPDNTEPFLIPMSVAVPRTCPGKNEDWVYISAFVVDQNDKILGAKHFYSKDEAKDPTVRFYLLPGDTKSIQIKVFYTEDRSKSKQAEQDSGEEKQTLDGCLCETEVVPVPPAK